MSVVVLDTNRQQPIAAAPARIPGHGGWRPNAGRKKRMELRLDPSHTARPELSYKHPVHVMLRTLPCVPRLRQRGGYEAIRAALVRFVEGDEFRVVHISVQANHLHLIVEAAHKQALGRGMQRFAIHAARALNSEFLRTGKVFAFRYCAKQIKTARYARNAIVYVLNNWRKHGEHRRNGQMSMPFDRFSSGPSFAGWATHASEVSDERLPVSQPRTALLTFEWQRFGLIGPFEPPAA